MWWNNNRLTEIYPCCIALYGTYDSLEFSFRLELLTVLDLVNDTCGCCGDLRNEIVIATMRCFSPDSYPDRVTCVGRGSRKNRPWLRMSSQKSDQRSAPLPFEPPENHWTLGILRKIQSLILNWNSPFPCLLVNFFMIRLTDESDGGGTSNSF